MGLVAFVFGVGVAIGDVGWEGNGFLLVLGSNQFTSSSCSGVPGHAASGQGFT